MTICEDAKRRVAFGGHETMELCLAREVVRLTEAMRRIASTSDEHDQPRNGWRIVEQMREIALDAIDNERTNNG